MLQTTINILVASYLVILESLYGIWLPFLFGSPRAPITFPRARSPLLIWILSFSRSPVLPVLRIRSDPARSTKWNLEHRICEFLLAVREPPRLCSISTVKMVWERLEWGFIWVAPVWRAVFPDSKRLKTSSSPSTSHSLTPHRTVEKEKHFLLP